MKIKQVVSLISLLGLISSAVYANSDPICTGQDKSYTAIHNVADLQIAMQKGGNYYLAADLTINKDNPYTAVAQFNGNFDGCQHNIYYDLQTTCANGAQYCATFIQKNIGNINNLRFVGESTTFGISGENVTMLSGFIADNFGHLNNISVGTMHVTLNGTPTNMGQFTGMMVAVNEKNATINNSYVDTYGNVSGGSLVGGMVGDNAGSIDSVRSGAMVTAENNNHAAGGLVGYNTGLINHGYTNFGFLVIAAKGNGHDRDSIGGLVGLNAAGDTIENSFTSATAKALSSDSYVGGLVGDNQGTLKNSWTDSQTTVMGVDDDYVGGLVGSTALPNSPSASTAQISQCMSRTSVTGAFAGGLVGLANNVEIDNSFVDDIAKVDGNQLTAGFIAAGNGKLSITNSYSMAQFQDSRTANGFIAKAFTDPNISDSYWDKDSSAKDNHFPGVTAKTTVELQQQSTFIGWGFKSIWYSPVAGQSAPQLRNLNA